MVRNAAAALMMVLGIAVVPAAAAEPSVSTLSTAAVAAAVATTEAAPLAADTDWSLPAVKMGSAPTTTSRGVILPSLYVSLAALNAYDVMSTRKGLAAGAVEANPVMGSVVGNTSSMIAIKAIATASTIVAAEKLWKKGHKGQAIAVMVISNGLMSAVAMHNTSVIRGMGR